MNDNKQAGLLIFECELDKSVSDAAPVAGNEPSAAGFFRVDCGAPRGILMMDPGPFNLKIARDWKDGGLYD